MEPFKEDILKFSSDINEVIRPVLNFFYKILHAQKTQKNTRHQKNANKWTKIKNALKNI